MTERDMQCEANSRGCASAASRAPATRAKQGPASGRRYTGPAYRSCPLCMQNMTKHDIP